MFDNFFTLYKKDILNLRDDEFNNVMKNQNMLFSKEVKQIFNKQYEIFAQERESYKKTGGKSIQSLKQELNTLTKTLMTKLGKTPSSEGRSIFVKINNVKQSEDAEELENCIIEVENFMKNE